MLHEAECREANHGQVILQLLRKQEFQFLKESTQHRSTKVAREPAGQMHPRLPKAMPGIPQGAITPAGIQLLQEKAIHRLIRSQELPIGQVIIVAIPHEAAAHINHHHSSAQLIPHLEAAVLQAPTDLQVQLDHLLQVIDHRHQQGRQDQATDLPDLPQGLQDR